MNDPALYSKANPFQSRDACYVLKEYKERLLQDAESDTILDIGCGSGNVTRNIVAPFCSKYHHIVAIDISKDMIDYAKKQNNSRSVNYEVLDITDDILDFRKKWGGFSKVFSFYCLHWVYDLPKAVSNIQRLMNVHGECLLVFVAQCPVFDMYEKLAQNSRWKEYMQDVSCFIPVTHHYPQPAFLFSQIMTEAGLQVEKCEIIEKEFTFASASLLKDCMCAVNPFLGRIEKDERNDFIMDCLRTLAGMKMAEMNNNMNRNHNANENNNNMNDRRFTYKLLVAQGRKN